MELTCFPPPNPPEMKIYKYNLQEKSSPEKFTVYKLLSYGGMLKRKTKNVFLLEQKDPHLLISCTVGGTRSHNVQLTNNTAALALHAHFSCRGRV